MQKGMRIVWGFMCIATIAVPILGLGCLKERFLFEHYEFILKEHFLAGICAGVGLAMWLAVCIIGTLRMFQGMYGVEMATYRFVIRKMREDDVDNKASGGDS